MINGAWSASINAPVGRQCGYGFNIVIEKFPLGCEDFKVE